MGFVKRAVLWVLGLGAIAGGWVLGWSLRSANVQVVDLDLIWIRVPNLELWWLVLLSIAAGFLLATLIVGFAWLRGALVNRRYRKSIRRLEAELHELRSLPLSGRGDAPALERVPAPPGGRVPAPPRAAAGAGRE
ncbi:MAG TPA: LapA family protein [Myxococcota bacterium]|nr:LapA family protein [Myxococcota bacterium]